MKHNAIFLVIVFYLFSCNPNNQKKLFWLPDGNVFVFPTSFKDVHDNQTLYFNAYEGLYYKVCPNIESEECLRIIPIGENSDKVYQNDRFDLANAYGALISDEITYFKLSTTIYKERPYFDSLIINSYKQHYNANVIYENQENKLSNTTTCTYFILDGTQKDIIAIGEFGRINNSSNHVKIYPICKHH